MDWNSLAAAFIGGIFGSGISGMVAVMQFRRAGVQALQARRWVDAEVVADVQTLLTDVHPQRRTINANPDSSIESKLWEGITERRDQLCRQLLLLANGHPSQEVATAAKEMELALVQTVHSSALATMEVLAHRDIQGVIATAEKHHAAAEKAMDKLSAAVRDATVPKRRWLGRTRRPELQDSGQSSLPQSAPTPMP